MTDSMVAAEMRLGLGYRSGKLSERTAMAAAVIVHTTGAGITNRYLREGTRKGDETPFDTANRVYQRIMQASAHYVVGQLGECSQTVPESHIAWHVGSGGTAPYFRSSWVPRWQRDRYAWWGARWRGLASPLDLAGSDLYRPMPDASSRAYRRGAVNPNTIGIEVVPPLADPQSEWSDACWETLTALVIDICARNAIPVQRTHVLTHSDAHPLSRTTRKGAPWDPGPMQWTWRKFASHARSHVPEIGASA